MAAGSGSVSTLLDVLARFRHANATDPRDIVYGLLGLVSEPHQLQVDYRLGERDIFAQLTRFLIDARGDLGVLCQRPWKAEGMPSEPHWAVDLGSGLDSLVEESRDDKRFHTLFSHDAIYQAGRPSCTVPVRVEDGNLLRLRGSVIGHLGPILQPEFHLTSMEFKRHRDREHMYWGVQDQMLLYFGKKLLEEEATAYLYGKGESELEAFWRTVVMDCSAYSVKRLDAEQIKNDKNVFRRILASMNPKQGPSATVAGFHPLFMELASWTLFMHTHEQWSFTVSKNGLFMMVLRGAREGDIVATLDGAQVPVLLREDGCSPKGEKKYILVNVAYVQGYMDGEAIAKAERGELDNQDFLLS